MYQCEEDMEAIWYYAAQLPAQRIDWVFVFSHTNDTQAEPLSAVFNAQADRLAGASISAIPSPGVGQWCTDLFRPKLQLLLYDADMSEKVADTFQYRAIGHGRPVPILRLHCPRHDQLLLCQVRAGACRRLPGWRHHLPEPCRWCGELIGRHSDCTKEVSEAARHLFVCPFFQLRPSMSCLFDEDPPQFLLGYLRRFAIGPVQARNALEGVGDTEETNSLLAVME